MSASDPPNHPPTHSADAPPKDVSTDAFSPPPESLGASEHPHLRVIYPDPQTISNADMQVEAATVAACRRIGLYEVLTEIARGGMGIVFKVRDPRLDRVVALKMIRGGSFCNPEELRRFQREAKVQAQVSHRHLLPVLDVGEHEGDQYFTMPFVSGGTVAKRLKEFVGQPKKAVALVAKVARAVAHAHQQGILHRDLKPSNILLDEQGEPLVADFGLAKQTDSSEQITRSNQMIGTPPYMAPEQADLGSLHEVTPQTDVWSLGVVLYELLTGKLPFPGKTTTEVFAKVRREPPPPPRRYLKDLDPALEKIILRCLEKEPQYRYPTAAALADDLDKWQKGEKVAPPPLPFSVRLRRVLDRWPIFKVLGAAALVLAVVLILWFALPPRAPEHAVVPSQPAATKPQPSETKPQEDYWEWVQKEWRAGRKVKLFGEYENPKKYKLDDLGGVLKDMRRPDDERYNFYVEAPTSYRLELVPAGYLPKKYRIRLELQHDQPFVPIRKIDDGIVGVYFMRNRLPLPKDRIADTYATVTIGNHGSIVEDYKDPQLASVCYLWGHFHPVKNWPDGMNEFSWNASRAVTPTPENQTKPRTWRTMVVEVRPEEVRVFLDNSEKQLFRAKYEYIMTRGTNPSKRMPFTKEEAPNAFASDGGFGLYVESARLFVRNLVIEPINE